MRLLLAGNWKMHGLKAALAEIRALGRALSEARPNGDIVICPPATLIPEAVRAAEGTRIAIGGQDCHAEAAGAFTGDISAEMLRDAGATHVIVGHSERRQVHGETDSMVAKKLAAAERAGLEAILCVGESEEVRNSGQAEQVVAAQLIASLSTIASAGRLALAYEPIWAIGSGRTPSLSEIEDMHGALRRTLVGRFGEGAAAVRILYGGSVKPANAGEILALNHVGGALVGGASLKAADFLAIVGATPER